MHMGVPWVYRNTFYLIGTPLFFKFCPYLGQNTSLQTVQKPKGGPLDEKIFFSKLSPIFLKHVPIDCICRADSKNIHIIEAKCPQGLCTLDARCAKRARSVHVPYRVLRPHVIHVFGIRTTNAIIWNMF